MEQLAVEMNRVSREFGSLCAVDEMTLEVPSGSIFGFLGPNGAGKTTTIRLLLGLLEPTRGEAKVLGLDTVRDAGRIRQHCGALLEHTGLYERMSAEDNLEFYGRVYQLSAAERKSRMKELLSGLGLYDRRKETVGQWSRGMKQKLAIARTLLHRPRMVFLDEPTAGLDPVAAAALRDDLLALVQKNGVTVFLTTHNLAEVEKLCSRVAVIRSGKLLMTGTPDQLRGQRGSHRMEIICRGVTETVLAALRIRPEVIRVDQNNGHLVLELKEDVDTAPLIQTLVIGGVAVDEVRKDKASLEEAFLALMEEEKETNHD